MTGLDQQLLRLPQMKTIQEALARGETPVLAVGLAQIHKAGVIHALTQNRGALVITQDEPTAVRLSEDIAAFFGSEELVMQYPSRDFTFRELEGASLEYEHARLKVLERLVDGRCHIVVASAEAACQKTIPPDELRRRMTVLRPGESWPVDTLVKLLLEAGYQRCDQVEGVCQFSVRGGIVDFYPPDAADPIRMELWGDEIDTIASFKVDTQRREQNLEETVISPAREVLLGTGEEAAALLEQKKNALRGPRAAAARARLEQDIAKLRDGLSLVSADRFLELAYEQPAILTDYAGDRLCFFCEPAGIKEGLRGALWQQGEDMAALLEEGLLLPGTAPFTEDFDRMLQEMERTPAVLLDSFPRSYGEISPVHTVTIEANQLSVWSGDMEVLVEDLHLRMEQGYSVAVLAGTARGADALAADLREHGIPAQRMDDLSQRLPRVVQVAQGGLPAGFEYPQLGFACITSGRVQTRKTPRQSRKAKERGDRIRNIADLTLGDYVVHVSHGIGIFEGIIKKEVQGVVKDYLRIRYGGTDMLYVPVTQLDLVTKYIGGREEGSVKLSRLNSGEWNKTRQRVKKAVSDMAKELIALYAKRLSIKGFAFDEDNDWQREFEERFEWNETDDQLRCIREIKEDMQSEVPMDRLLCGDVGFGKTEVALRAAFKCVLSSKQCAVLVPTTILAWQHFQTFRRRMEGYPIRIELLSRFRTPKQQAEIVRQLKTGEVDIVIGTHRLVSKDIQFKDLGLCIIDEEQRFGVAHKEKLKELRGNVDVLTLSATPIPRTLNMAMSGIRDMSIIEEAPQDRHPVQTYVMEHDDGILLEAIKKELRRGGQVFYLHNRVDSIESCAARLQQSLPDASIRTAHGKMGEKELSQVWRSLVERETDILVCTTIIETGVDVPNCNTLIIEDADRMGLSQLYQLRGRVGRSGRRAFAYLTFRRGKVLSEVAEKRLSAIREFTSFGSGFRIAMRDLEIRGAGDILGSQQHGHMEAVGYDLYLRLLGEAVSEQRGEPVKKSNECTVDIQIGAHLPEEYIGNLSQRIDIYKKIAAIESEEDALDLTDELIDRFGDPPPSVKGLVDVALIRGTAASLGIREISQRGESMLLYPESLDLARIAHLANGLRGRVMVNAGSKPYISVKMLRGQNPVDAIREILAAMGEETPPEEKE